MFSFFVLTFACDTARAGSLLASVFSDSMVLQRGVANQIWGYTSAGARVNVSLNGAFAAWGTADVTGLYRALLPPQNATLIAATLSVSSSAGGAFQVSDVLFGDVFLCSGQSNMVFSVSMAQNASAELAAANGYPSVRVANVPDYVGSWQPSPRADFVNRLAWRRASNASLAGTWNAGFSAVCWFAGRDTFDRLGGGVPVGLISSAIGATSIKEWSPTSALAKCQQTYVSTGRNIGVFAHSQLFNGMIAPFTTGPTRLTAVLWDQAESDSFPTTPDGFYACQQPATVNAWRAALGDPALPWGFVQLGPCSGAVHWGTLRQEQLAALALPHTFFAPSVDLGDAASPWGDVHSTKKQGVGARLAAALATEVYHAPPGPPGAPLRSYPPPSFLDQAVFTSGTNQTVVVTLQLFGSPVAYNASAGCDDLRNGTLCGFNMAIQTDDGNGNLMWWNASLQSVVNAADNSTATLTFVSVNPRFSPQQCAVGTAYAQGAWMAAQLVTEDGWPVTPWNQSQTVWGPC